MAGVTSFCGGSSSSNTNDNKNNNNKLYKGVRLRKWGKWVSEIRLPNSRERIWLGSHDSAEKAARAFDAALYCLRGRHASFNFPDTPSKMMELQQDHINILLQQSSSLTTHEIQQIAANFANRSDTPQQHSSKTEEESATATSSTSTMYHDQVQVDNGDIMMMNTNNNSIDWTFLNVLGDHTNYHDDHTRFNDVAAGSSTEYYNLGLYSDQLEKMHSGELFYSTTPPPPLYDDDDEIVADPFSNQSFLWNWDF